jgi:hypothetical protein
MRLEDADWREIEAHGLTREEAVRQTDLFTRPSRYVHLERPCALGDGLQSFTEADRRRYAVLHDKAARAGRLGKFVPASGAATRMFDSLARWQGWDEDRRRAAAQGAPRNDRTVAELKAFADGIKRFPFYDDLKRLLARRKLDPAALAKRGELGPLVDALLGEKGLGYASLPKGLMPWHRRGTAVRTPLEEHLWESADLARDADGLCRVHFTVAEEHQERFESFHRKVRPAWEKAAKSRAETTFSVQHRSTDTLAVDLQGHPFRRADGRLLFRPGGHGALLTNLNALDADVVFIRNIDNVPPDRLRPLNAEWKKALCGLLLELQEEVFRCTGWIHQHPDDERVIADALRFLSRRLSIPVSAALKSASVGEKRRILLSKLHRPMRVCGMVRNEGEPGGGPFWVKNRRGELSLQIVESAQVNPSSDDQQVAFENATHFNPVDMVCALRDWQGKPFDLFRHRDPEAVIITKKTEEGRELMALERPGLWNGGMADWNTVFVEIPSELFLPVKTVNDLLRAGHQPAKGANSE